MVKTPAVAVVRTPLTTKKSCNGTEHNEQHNYKLENQYRFNALNENQASLTIPINDGSLFVSFIQKERDKSTTSWRNWPVNVRFTLYAPRNNLWIVTFTHGIKKDKRKPSRVESFCGKSNESIFEFVALSYDAVDKIDSRLNSLLWSGHFLLLRAHKPHEQRSVHYRSGPAIWAFRTISRNKSHAFVYILHSCHHSPSTFQSKHSQLSRIPLNQMRRFQQTTPCNPLLYEISNWNVNSWASIVLCFTHDHSRRKALIP